METETRKTFDIYVTYLIHGAEASAPESSIVPVPRATKPSDIPGYIRTKLRPQKMPDPSDGYRGQSSSEVIILNMVKLSNLL